MTPSVEAVLKEFRTEVPPTPRLLELVPRDKLPWKPHNKSRSLGELAAHIAGIGSMAERIATTDEYTAGSASPLKLHSPGENRERFDQNVRSVEEALGNLAEQIANAPWRLGFQGKKIFSKPRR